MWMTQVMTININGCRVFLQFIFDSSGVGHGTGDWLCVTLGIWHPYKQANTVVWSHWGLASSAPTFTTSTQARISSRVRDW